MTLRGARRKARFNAHDRDGWYGNSDGDGGNDQDDEDNEENEEEGASAVSPER